MDGTGKRMTGWMDKGRERWIDGGMYLVTRWMELAEDEWNDGGRDGGIGGWMKKERGGG